MVVSNNSFLNICGQQHPAVRAIPDDAAEEVVDVDDFSMNGTDKQGDILSKVCRHLQSVLTGQDRVQAAVTRGLEDVRQEVATLRTQLLQQTGECVPYAEGQLNGEPQCAKSSSEPAVDNIPEPFSSTRRLGKKPKLLDLRSDSKDARSPRTPMGSRRHLTMRKLPTTLDKDNEEDFVLHDVWRTSPQGQRRSWTSPQNSEMLRSKSPVGQLTSRPKPASEGQKRLSSRRLILHPQSNKRMAWDIMGVLVLAYDIYWIPMQVFNPPESTATTFMGYLTIAYWTADIYFSLTTGFFNRRGEVVSEPKKILYNYLKTWFVLDLLIVGADWTGLVIKLLEDTAGSGKGIGLVRLGKIARVGRVFRALRLLRVMKLRQLMVAIQERISSQYFSIVMSMMLNIMSLMIINHFVGVLWYALGQHFAEPGDPTSSWTAKKNMNDDQTTFLDKYVTSLHWSLTQFTPASSDVFPTNPYERFFAVATLLAGMLVFSSFVSTITASISRLRNLRAEEFHQFLMLRKFISDNNISADLSARLTRYIELVGTFHKKKVQPEKVALLRLLSGPLNVELHQELYMPYLVKVPFLEHFNGRSASAMSQLCFSAVQDFSLSKGDELFTSGTRSNGKLMVLNNGTLFYHRARGKLKTRRVVMLQKGQYFCESVLWVPWVHQGVMKTLVESEIIALDAQRFMEVTVTYSIAYQTACEHARDHVQELQETLKKHGRVWDLPLELIEGTTMSPLAERDPSSGEVKSAEEMEMQLLILGELSDEEGEEGNNSLCTIDTEGSC
eukprot:TRINITY_DN18809_c0_g1_i2.p1 TRINITY_DN18809_c0_g1~~TRINITY_DN18809_c0_g1_i2.p1  ORF type:complete len:781 (-),score=153.24 TRINITY_DN18809_c0_g1_i2:14-2356(-)